MAYADIDNADNRQDTKDKQKTPYLKISEGERIIRILDERAVKFYAHFVNGSNVQCLGESCPICFDNQRIIGSNPKDFRNDSNFKPRRQVFYTNIFDRTTCKTCPKCGEDVYKSGGNYVSNCPKCSTFIAAVAEAPSNKVKLLNKGAELFTDLNNLQTAMVAAGAESDLRKFDLMLVTKGAGKEIKTSIVPLPQRNDALDPNLVLLEIRGPLLLEPKELEDLVRGVGLRDIFAARRSEEKPAEAVVVDKAEVAKRVKVLFEEL